MKKIYLEPRTNDYVLKTGKELMVEIGTEPGSYQLAKGRRDGLEDYDEDEEELEEFLSAVEEKPLW